MPAKEKESPTKGEVTRLAVEDAAIKLFWNMAITELPCGKLRSIAGSPWVASTITSKARMRFFEAIVVDKHPYKRILPLISAVEGDTIEEFPGNAARIVIAELTSQPYYLKLMLIELVEFNGIHGAGDRPKDTACF